MPADVLRYCALAITYSLLAWSVLEALQRLWQLRDPALLFRFRLVVLAIPPLAPLLFAPFGPIRGSDPFRDQVALLDTRNWLGAEPNLAQPGWMLLAVAMSCTTLFLVVLEMRETLRRPIPRRDNLAKRSGLPLRLKAAPAGLPGSGAGRVEMVVVDRPEVAAFTHGFRHHTVVVSRGLCDLLDPEEIQAVLAHEMAHARRRDTRLGWLLFGLRLLSFYNPVALLVFHRMGHDIEQLCDAEAAVATTDPLALASALIKVYRASTGRRVPRGMASGLAERAMAVEQHARRTLVEDRVERLLHPTRIEPACWPDLRLALSIAAVLSLAFLVV
jgi:hypothetical protein